MKIAYLNNSNTLGAKYLISDIAEKWKQFIREKTMEL